MAERWQEVDEFLTDLFGLQDAVLNATVESTSAAGMPMIQVSAAYGAFLNLLARAANARRILEVGTLAGYSTIWLARALPADGRLVSLELEQRHADVARANLERAGVSEQVEIVVGPAAELLRRLADVGTDAFDLIFIDADKDGYPEYLKLALELSRSGTLIVADNVVRGGQVATVDSGDGRVMGVRRFLEDLAADERLDATVVQTVGAKGYDGMAIARVR